MEMSDLRTRIIKAAAGYLRESGAYFDHYCDDDVCVDGDISLVDLADAVIAELGLQPEARIVSEPLPVGGLGDPRVVTGTEHRYVTDWTANE